MDSLKREACSSKHNDADLLDQGELFAAASDVIVSNLVQEVLLVLALDGLTLTVDLRVGSNNAVWSRLKLNNLKRRKSRVRISITSKRQAIFIRANTWKSGLFILFFLGLKKSNLKHRKP